MRRVRAVALVFSLATVAFGQTAGVQPAEPELLNSVVGPDVR